MLSIFDYLNDVYPTSYGKPTPLSFSPRYEETSASIFEIKDRKPSILQPKGEGVSCFENAQRRTVLILDFEKYINDLRTGRASEGKKCDFILVPHKRFDYIILNEVTATDSQYLDPFIQPQTQKPREGKCSMARRQLSETIAKLSKRSRDGESFLEPFTRRIALFSYRLPQSKADTPREIADSFGKFLSTTAINNSISANEPFFAVGFIYEQRIYPEPYSL